MAHLSTILKVASSPVLTNGADLLQRKHPQENLTVTLRLNAIGPVDEIRALPKGGER